MRLNQIKLSGFKSFAEPPTFQLPGQRIGLQQQIATHDHLLLRLQLGHQPRPFNLVGRKFQTAALVIQRKLSVLSL